MQRPDAFAGRQERLSSNDIHRLTLAFVEAYPIFRKIPGWAFSVGDARRLMREFVFASKEVHVSGPLGLLLPFVRVAFERFLNGEVRTLDQAFRLGRSKRGGRKPFAFEGRFQLATEVEQQMKAGDDREDAIRAVAELHQRKESYVRDAHDEFASYVRLFQME